MERIIQQSKDYQLESLINSFTRFRREVSTNSADEVLSLAIYLAKQEQEKRLKEIK